MQSFDDGRIRFEYPSDWEVDVASTDEGSVVTAASGETAFWSLALFPKRPGVERVMNSALEAFRDDYDELDIYDEGSDEARRSKECSLEFVCHELIAGAHLHAFASPAGTALVLYQFADVEREHVSGVLEAISESLEFVDDSERPIFE